MKTKATSRLVVVLMTILLLHVLVLTLIQTLLPLSAAYRTAVTFLHDEASVVEKYGVLQKKGLFIRNSYVHVADVKGDACFRFRAKETAQDVWVFVRLDYAGGAWTVVEWNIVPIKGNVP